MNGEFANVDPLVRDVLELVRCESPSADLAAVARSADVVAGVGSSVMGRTPERIVRDGVAHLRWRFGCATRVLVLAHHDTVWPIGSLERNPGRVSGGILTGPGCFDMKAGLAMAFHAIASLPHREGVTLIVTGDEERGSPSSRALIEDEARGALAVLVTEPSASGGALKIERKGASFYEVCVRGRASHAGLEPKRGISATIELAYQVGAVATLGSETLGTTVTPTAIQAGKTPNTVPAAGSFHVDVRARTVREQDRIDRGLRNLQPHLPGAVIRVVGGPNRPPLESAASEALFDRIGRVAARLGIEQPTGTSVGGGSDGNFTAGVGAPTLDGLGAVGGGAHAEDEHVIVAQLAPRTALLSALLSDLLRD